ncbi:hypothetical protein VTN77DRAFT_1972 [Rasamsonia byssochlamydoides]|uniref:uncharacterized protein n=1 Tax=Rasamsonia byssochlamydoides TaxID=89139 RepID=UPI003742CE23
MSEHRYSPTGLLPPGESTSVLALLEQEFIDLSNEIADKLSAETKILLDGAGLQLYVFHFLETGSEARRKGLLRAYHTAMALISKVRDADATSNLMAYAPASYYRLTTLAATVILKILHSSYSRYVDADSGKRIFNAAISLVRRASVEDNDLPGRSSKILAQLWSVQGQSNQRKEEPSLRLRTRLGASLLHDSLWTWREKCGGQGSGTETPADPMQPGEAPPRGDVFEGQSIGESNDTELDSLNVDELFDVGMFSLFPLNLDSDPALLPMP